MDRVQGALSALTMDRRADYLFDTKIAAQAVGCIPTKFGEWWHRSKRKLKELYKVQPGQLAAELAVLMAEAESEKQQDANSRRAS